MSGKRVGMPHCFELLLNRKLRITRDDADREVAVLLPLRDQNVARRGGLFCHEFYLKRIELIATLAHFDATGELSAEFPAGLALADGEIREVPPEINESARHARCAFASGGVVPCTRKQARPM
ncbi:MAG: hypothetical protein ACRD3G_04650 [Vicinamibacterales bacterium]